MKATETIYSDKKEVSCNGGTLGHPKVYLNMGPANEVVCPYCSRKFIYKNDATTVKTA